MQSYQDTLEREREDLEAQGDQERAEERARRDEWLAELPCCHACKGPLTDADGSLDDLDQPAYLDTVAVACHAECPMQAVELAEWQARALWERFHG